MVVAIESGPIAVAVEERELKLLVEWSSPWEEFRSAIGPAFSRSTNRLAGEAHTGIFPYRGILLTWVLEIALLAFVIWLPTKLALLTPYQPVPQQAKYDVIYYSGDELPRTEDAGGAQSGKSGRAGGREAYHRTQTIKVARGSSLREKIVDAPNLKLPISNSAVANLLAFKSIPGPPPAEGIKPSLRLPSAPQASVVAPAPSVQRDQMQQSPMLNATVVAPAPAAPQRQMPPLQIPGSRMTQVVPPPVSAPEREITNLNPKLTLPAPAVAPPMPTELSTQLSPRGPGFGAGEVQKQVVPPPVQVSGTGSPRQNGFARMGGDVAVVAPPVDLSNRSVSRAALPGMGGGNASVVAPPVQISGGLSRTGTPGMGGNVAVAAPAPSLSGTGAVGGHGQGSRGAGFGGLGDSGDVAAPPKSGGAGNGNGIVVSSKPGSQVGLPGGGGNGALAMSPKGGTDAGLGGSGGGTGIGRGTGPGSGFTGEGPGAGKEGVGRGSDPTARGGISPYPGPGGAGNGVNGNPAMPGVSVRGGSNNIVTLPSFGADGDMPTDLSRSSVGKEKHGPGITVVATSRSGGAFNFYGYLKGDKVYTIYIDTSIGPAVMQFADPTTAMRASSVELNAPEPLRADLPAGILKSRIVVSCILDISGGLKNLRVLESGDAVSLSKVLATLPRWKFRPAMRGTTPVEVNAILGFNVDTSDRR